MSSEAEANLLVVLLDLHPVWWADHSLPDMIQGALVLANAHLLQGPLNKLSVYGYLNTGVYQLFPCEEYTSLLADTTTTSGKYEGFDTVNTTILMKIKDVMAECGAADDHRQLDGSLLSGALIKALCYCNMVSKEVSIGTTLHSRILILKGSPDCRGQYMAIMNAIFAAQKNKVAIDSCVLGEDSTFLQQAGEITGGTYVRVSDHNKLVQYLLSVFLMGVEFRKTFHTPPPQQVDFRAACQCHGRMTDVGYVCSVCMSVYCSFRPTCLVCSAHFKLPGALARVKKGAGKRKLENGK